MARAAQKALALAQQEKSTWTRADVIKYLGRVLPRFGLDPAAAAALLEDFADRALASEFEPVTCLADLAQHYGVARNTVTKALRRLADDGFVEIVPSWGTFRARS